MDGGEKHHLTLRLPDPCLMEANCTMSVPEVLWKGHTSGQALHQHSYVQGLQPHSVPEAPGQPSLQTWRLSKPALQGLALLHRLRAGGQREAHVSWQAQVLLPGRGGKV